MVDRTQFRLTRTVPIMALLLRNSCLYCYLASAIPSCYAVEQKHEIASVITLKFCPVMGLVNVPKRNKNNMPMRLGRLYDPLRLISERRENPERGSEVSVCSMLVCHMDIIQIEDLKNPSVR